MAPFFGAVTALVFQKQ